MRTHLRARCVMAGSIRLCWFVAFLIVSAGWFSVFAQATRQAKAGQAGQTAAVIGAVRASFGSSLEPMTGFKPFYVAGDFNGDDAQDLVVVVRIKGRSTDLPVDVKVYNPFERPKAIFPDDPAANPTLALAIVHGSQMGWQTQPVAQKFLLFGQTPILILQHQRAVSASPDDAKNLMELLKKSSRVWGNLGWSSAAAKGDAILMGTEATDSILYWNGTNYRWVEGKGGE